MMRTSLVFWGLLAGAAYMAYGAEADKQEGAPASPSDVTLSKPAASGHPYFLANGGFPDLASLPLLRNGIQTFQQANYDRAGDNYDHEYFPLYVEANGEQVLFDDYGPGLLSRLHMNIWRPGRFGLGETGDVVGLDTIRIRFYFDDETTPRIDMDVSIFFSEKNPLGIFRPPYADGDKDYRVFYYPFYFKKRLKVALSAEPGGPGPKNFEPWMGRFDKLPQRRSHWYQFTYHLYTEDPGIESWTPTAHTPPTAPPYASLSKTIGAMETRTFSKAIDAGQSQEMALFSGQGCIRELRFNLAPLNKETLFGAWVRIFFNDQTVPFVDAPAGVLFGAHPEQLDAFYSALLMGYEGEKGMYLRTPMPFWKSARIVIENRSKQPLERATVQWAVDTQASGKYPQEKSGYFHVAFNREFPRTEGHDYIYLDIRGRGHVVGHLAQRFGTCMEENERTYFDGSRTPQIKGNGFEDDHGFGWGLKKKTFPMFGAPVARGGDGSLYRLFLSDLYIYYSSIRHGHQVYGPNSPRGHENMYEAGNQQSVTYYYGINEPALQMTDEVDVGNPESERNHAYRARGRNNRQLARVYVDGQLVAERPWYTVDYERTYRNIRWYDTSFEIPARYTAGKDQLRIRIEHAGSEYGGIDEFRYWIYSYN